MTYQKYIGFCFQISGDFVPLQKIVVYMGNWSVQQEAKKEVKEKDKVRREKLAGFFFNLAQLTFAGLVLGGITPIYANVEAGINWYVLTAGSVWTIMLAKVGNTILK